MQCKSLCANVRAFWAVLQTSATTNFFSFDRAISELQLSYRTYCSRMNVRSSNNWKTDASKNILATSPLLSIIFYRRSIVLNQNGDKKARCVVISVDERVLYPTSYCNFCWYFVFVEIQASQQVTILSERPFYLTLITASEKDFLMSF